MNFFKAIGNVVSGLRKAVTFLSGVRKYWEYVEATIDIAEFAATRYESVGKPKEKDAV